MHAQVRSSFYLFVLHKHSMDACSSGMIVAYPLGSTSSPRTLPLFAGPDTQASTSEVRMRLPTMPLTIPSRFLLFSNAERQRDSQSPRAATSTEQYHSIGTALRLRLG